VHFGIADGAIAGEFTASPGTLAAPDGAALGDLELSFDYKPGRNQLMVGALRGRLARLSVEGAEGFSIEGLRLTSSTSGRGDALEWIANVDFDRALAGGVEYGGGSAELTAHRLDTGGYAELKALVESMILNTTRSPNLFKPLRSSLGNLAAAAPDFQLTKLSLRSGLGEVSARGRAHFAEVDPAVAGDPLQAMHHFEAELQAQMPRAWLEKVAGAEAARTALEGNWLVADGESYRFAMRYGHGELLVNGRKW